ncbi:MAG TPA: hypothetical protein VEY70_15275 [Metabacillus sp.]|nr:hypothetical protein [Metabacillus sp.]
MAFTSEDIHLDAPPLFIGGFDILFSRILKEISLGMYTLHVILSTREDIIKLYKELTDLSQTYYALFTEYLLEKGNLPQPITTTLPKASSFITNKNYLKGTNLFGEKSFQKV